MCKEETLNSTLYLAQSSSNGQCKSSFQGVKEVQQLTELTEFQNDKVTELNT